MNTVRPSNSLKGYCSDQKSIDLVLNANELPHPAWFSAKTFLEPKAAAYGIERYLIAVEVGLRDDIAAYPCFFTVNPSTYRELLQMDLGWDEFIAQGIQATVFECPQFAKFLRQRTCHIGSH